MIKQSLQFFPDPWLAFLIYTETPSSQSWPKQNKHTLIITTKNFL